MAEALSQYLWPSVAYLLTGIVHALLLLGLVAVGTVIFIWMERKIAGRIQDRLGPTRVGGKFGWLQTVADGLKLATKEDTMPRDADPILFKIAPYVALCASYATFIVLPFATGWSAVTSSISIFLIIAILGVEVFGVILAGYSSGSKWSLFGAMREAAQVVSYEVPLGLCVLVPVMIAGTMDLNVIGEMQRGWFTNWLVFHDPFTFLVFFVYITCATASVNRAPFDLAEAESELVAGFHTEYSGVRWSVFFMAEYNSMLLVSFLASILFLGGWHGPIPIFTSTGIAYESSAAAFSWGGFLANVAGVANLLFKGFAGVAIMMWVRWTLPRLRIDQVMRTCLKYCTPLACFCFLGAAIWTWAFPGGMLLKAEPYAGFREADEMALLPVANSAGTEARGDFDESVQSSGLASNDSALSQSLPGELASQDDNRRSPATALAGGDN
ncbi:MAG: NADH-quinone oxidoreductase subunit NuoH [Pirellulales bacterium]|nr:NADH-quinone oxidoreductase subunit NuoH [Pirellulales bacterium]